MIKSNDSIAKSDHKVKAVGLLSGGLDSMLACKIMVDLGVEVHAVYFSQPWGCCDKDMAMQTAQALGIKFIPMKLDERYLEIIRNPKFGYGAALNPCRDCRIHMFKRAGDYMRSIDGDFVFTGEVVGQRPMSQLSHSMRSIEKETGLEGRLLRPLCAQLMEPTIVEEQGLIDRTKLLRITGRGRKDQLALAEKYGLTEFPNPAGGCLLTDKNFSRRMQDTLDYGYRNFRETIALQWGRHFRINQNFKIIVGRDEHENEALVKYAHGDDIIMEMPTNDGPTAIVKGDHPSEDILGAAAGLIQRYSKYKHKDPVDVIYWKQRDQNDVHTIQANKLKEEVIEEMFI